MDFKMPSSPSMCTTVFVKNERSFRLELFFLALKTYANLLLPHPELNQEIASSLVYESYMNRKSCDNYVILPKYFINILCVSVATFH